MATTTTTTSRAVTGSSAGKTVNAMPTPSTTGGVVAKTAGVPPSSSVTQVPVLTPAATDQNGSGVAQADAGTAAPKAPRKRQRTSTGGAAGGPDGSKTNPSTETSAPTTNTGATSSEEKTTGNENGSWLIVAKSVRTLLKNMPENVHCSADALPMLNSRVQELLHEAAGRAAGNSRKTLKPCDF